MPWLFRLPGGTRRLQPEFALIVDGSDAARTAATFGTGIAQAGAESTAALIASASLVTVLDAYAPLPWALWLLRAPGPAGTALAAVMDAFVAAFRELPSLCSPPD